MDSVFAYSEGNDDNNTMLNARADVANGKFLLNIAKPPTSTLSSITSIFASEYGSSTGLTISDTTATIAHIGFQAKNSYSATTSYGLTYVSSSYMSLMNAESANDISKMMSILTSGVSTYDYIYSSKPATVTGTLNLSSSDFGVAAQVKLNLSLTQGWNAVKTTIKYVTSNASYPMQMTMTSTTSVPSSGYSWYADSSN